MRLLADENIDQLIVDRLREDGHRVESVAEWSPGIDDEEVLSFAVERNALLLTADKDFGHLVFLEQRASVGVLLIRLAGLSSQRKAQLVSLALKDHGHRLPKCFAILSPSSIRIRSDLY